MMDSCLITNVEKREQVEAEDVKSDLSSDTDTRRSCMEERDYLQVYLRIRPFTSSESNSGESQDCVTIEPPDKVLLKPPSLSLAARLSADKSLPQTGQRFQFSQVYGPETTQRELFDGTVKDLVKDVLEGENSLLFTYGVTNAGKTFTFLGPDADAGILPRSLDVIFGSIDERVFPGMSIKPQRCREFLRLSGEQQAEEAAFKRNLLRPFKESERTNASLLNLTSKTLLEGTFVLGTTDATRDKIPLKVEANTKFSVWVSFCEIYNENIHDLLEVAPSGALRRTALRLSQDVKGNAFVKDLRWVQVNSAEEAYKVVKLGKKNQSFSSTRLNHLSSRSHSIFSIRILRIEDDETQRVHAVGELCLCDLAGSERCAKTQNKGERLKEAGNINTSLLILGKCINALRINQQAKLLQHVPFRESKLTHYLQGFFCGRGKACMVVNINQCASMYDETLNVLRFSAVAQKVVILSSRPLCGGPSTSSGEVSFLHGAGRKGLQRSSPTGWESSLEDVQEDDDDECEEETSLMEDAMDQTGGERNEDGVVVREKARQVALWKQLQVQLKEERAENLLMEARVREEISQEFSELFSEMQNDYDERLARERDILEERAERRMEIFKNLIDKMSVTGTSQDGVAMDRFMDSELADIKNSIQSPHARPGSGRAVPLATERPEERDRHQRQEAQKHDVVEDEEKRRLLLQLGEKSLEVAQLEKRPGDSQKVAKPGSQSVSVVTPEEKRSHEREQLQEALASLEKERREREDTLAALEYQTLGKEEALASLQEERRAREEAIISIQELRRHKEEMLASLEEERKDKITAMAALEEERRAKKDAVAASIQERGGKEEAEAALELQRKELRRLLQEREEMQQEVRRLTDRLEAADHQVTSRVENAECTFIQLQAARAQLEERSKEVQEKSAEASALTQDVQRLKQELQNFAVSSEDVRDQQRGEVSGLRRNLAEEKEESDGKRRRILELERQLEQTKQQLAHNQLDSEQQLRQFTEEAGRSEAASKQQVEELRKKLQEGEASHQTLEELRSQLECQKQASREEVEKLRVKLQEQTQASEEQEQQLREKLREQDVSSEEKLDELERKLREGEEASSKVVEELEEKLREQEQRLNRAAVSSSSEAEDLRRLISDLQGEVSSLKAKLSSMEATRETEEKLAELEKASAQKEAELQKKLQETEAQLTSLQESLKEAREQREDEERQAAQEARRREAERRRELLAVAHEAIAQKDAELEQKAEEISSLKEKAKQDSEKLKSLGLDLQRKEDDSSDLREKLADYKKQIQQVQKEISAMREDEKALRQKLADVEKAKKQLQSEVANRDRSIQQLKTEQSSTKSDHTLQLYQKACKDLEDGQRVMEDMRLALTEQEETQEQMELVLEEKLALVEELSSEVEKLKGLLLQDRGNGAQQHGDSQSDDLKLAKEQASQAQESLKEFTEKHQAERRKWMEEKLSLIGQAKEAEDKRNREMRKFAEDRERSTRLQSQLESQLQENQRSMETWRKERDALVAALEVQLQKLLSSQAEKDKLIQQLRQQHPQPPPEVVGDAARSQAELQAALSEREAEILQLREQLQASAAEQQTAAPQTESSVGPAALAGKPESDDVNAEQERRNTRTSVSSQSSAGFPSVLDSSEISTENGRTSRFPRPELEISFSPLQPNRMALRRQGEEGAVTVKITRSARKRKSGEMEKEEVEAENRRNTRAKVTPTLTPHKEENSSPAGCHDSPSSIRSRKEGTLQKIGGFLQSSPTLFGTKAKKMMSLVSGRSDVDSASSSSSFSLRVKKNKKKLYTPEISAPMDMPSHPIISRMPEERDGDHQIIKRRLRSRVVK
ncbi:uncharacterized protein kif20ba isoform 2-T2 [Odontesthes bonariensis]